LFVICNENNIDWKVVFALADLHGVAPLIYANLRRCQMDVPAEILEQFKISLMRNMVLKTRFEKNLVRANSFFKEKSIRVMLVKGAALDVLVYDQPYYTVYNDVDLVLDIKREDIGDQEHKEFMDYFHHSGVEYDYFSHHDITQNDVLPINFQQIWDSASQIKYKDQNVFAMSPEDMLLSLCINSCRKRFFRLKAICDIAETVAKYPNLDWNDFVQKSIEYDCQFIIYTALFVTKMTVGCSVPGDVFKGLKVNPVRAKIIHYLSQQMSLDSFASLFSDKKVFSRSIDWTLLLSYASYHTYQIGRRIRFVSTTTEKGLLRG